MKFLLSVFIGILGGLGLGYLVLKMQKDKSVANQIDAWVWNFGQDMKNKAKKFGQRITDMASVKSKDNVTPFPTGKSEAAA